MRWFYSSNRQLLTVSGCLVLLVLLLDCCEGKGGWGSSGGGWGSSSSGSSGWSTRTSTTSSTSWSSGRRSSFRSSWARRSFFRSSRSYWSHSSTTSSPSSAAGYSYDDTTSTGNEVLPILIAAMFVVAYTFMCIIIYSATGGRMPPLFFVIMALVGWALTDTVYNSMFDLLPIGDAQGTGMQTKSAETQSSGLRAWVSASCKHPDSATGRIPFNVPLPYFYGWLSHSGVVYGVHGQVDWMGIHPTDKHVMALQLSGVDQNETHSSDWVGKAYLGVDANGQTCFAMRRQLNIEVPEPVNDEIRFLGYMNHTKDGLMVTSLLNNNTGWTTSTNSPSVSYLSSLFSVITSSADEETKVQKAYMLSFSTVLPDGVEQYELQTAKIPEAVADLEDGAATGES